MKVYLIETTTDKFTSIENVFTTFRGASEHLIDEGYTPYFYEFLGEYKLIFYVDDREWYDTEAIIIERELTER